jgi:tetratricopeptide (TPR) repeat protein
VKYNIAEILSDQGHVDEAVDMLRDVIRQWRAAGAETDVAEAWREMARALARGGEIEHARRLLDDARAVQVAHGQPGEVLTTDARSAEVDVLAGDSSRALELVDELSTRARATDGGSALGPTLARIRGWALLQLGRSDDARDAFEASRRQSRDRGDDYQVALALDGLIAARAPGADVSDLEAERQAIVERLGIAATPVVPLAEAGAAR